MTVSRHFPLLWGVVSAVAGYVALSHVNDVLHFSTLGHAIGPASPDAWTRLAQLRDWLAGGSFFDHTAHRTNAPVGGVETHWTRPLDFLLAYFYKLMPQGLDVNTRLMLSATVLPPLLLVFTFGWIAKAAQRHVKSVHAAGCAALLLVFSPITTGVFTPGDADHHGLLVMMWCAALWCIVRPLVPLSAWMLGCCIGLMGWVSLEGLMLGGLIFIVLGVEALRNPERMPTLRHALVAAAFTVTAVLFAEEPSAKILSTVVYDKISIVHAALMWLCVAGAFVLDWIYRRPMPFSARAAVAGAVGAAVLYAMLQIYPKFFMGPHADVAPFVIEQFFPRIKEAMPLLWRSGGEILRELVMPGLAVAVLAVAWRNKRPARQRRVAIMAGLLTMTFFLTLWQYRCGNFMQPVAHLSIAMFLPGVAGGIKSKALPRAWRSYAEILIWACLAGFIASLKTPAPVHENAYCMAQIRHAAQDGRLQQALGNKKLVLMTHEDAGGDILFFTPYSILAGNYHREGEGMKALFDIIYAKDEKAARKLMKDRKIGAIFACHTRYRPNSWLRQAGDGGKFPAWLKPAPVDFPLLPGPKPLLLKVKA